MRRGSYVKATRLVDYSPHTLIDEGETGRVLGEVEGLVLVKLSRSHPGLAPWGNTVTLMPEDAEAMQPTLDPRLMKRVLGAALGVAACVLGVVLLPRVNIEPAPGPLHAEMLYLREGPPAVTRINKMLDGHYEVGVWSHPRPGVRYGEQLYKRTIKAEDLEEELRKLE